MAETLGRKYKNLLNFVNKKQEFLYYTASSTAESGGKKGGKKKGGSFQTVSAMFRVMMWFHFYSLIFYNIFIKVYWVIAYQFLFFKQQENLAN